MKRNKKIILLFHFIHFHKEIKISTKLIFSPKINLFCFFLVQTNISSISLIIPFILAIQNKNRTSLLTGSFINDFKHILLFWDLPSSFFFLNLQRTIFYRHKIFDPLLISPLRHSWTAPLKYS